MSFPLSDIQLIQLAGGQSVVVPVASSLTGLSPNPLFYGDLFVLESDELPAAPLDGAALQVTFDGTPVPCDVQQGNPGLSWQCTVGAGVKKIGLTYTGATPAVPCATAEECCVDTTGSAGFCACSEGQCVTPIILSTFKIVETTMLTGPCAPPTQDPDD